MATFNTRLTLIRTRLEETTENVHSDDVIRDDYNQACREVVAKTNHRDFIAEYDFNATASQAGFALPSDFREVLTLYRGSSNTKLQRETLEEVEGVSLTDTGTPDHYRIVGATMYLRPVPSTTASFHLKYRTWPAEMTGTSSTVPVPDYMFTACEAFTLARQYEQVGDDFGANVNWGIYDREIGNIIAQQYSANNRDHYREPNAAW